MASWFDWWMRNSKFESLPKKIKDTVKWRKYQTTINTAEVSVTAAKQKLDDAKKAAEGYAAEQLEYGAETAQHNELLAEGAHNAKAQQIGGRRRKRRRTKKRRRKRRKKTRGRHR